MYVSGVSFRMESVAVLTPLLQCNDIGQDGAGALVAALMHNDSLRTLDISVRP